MKEIWKDCNVVLNTSNLNNTIYVSDNTTICNNVSEYFEKQ